MMRRPRKIKIASGTWLAFLSLAIQVLVPFFVAGDLAATAAQTDSEHTVVICSALGITRIPAPQEGSHHRHGLLNGCPICTALAAGHAYTRPAPLVIPLPQVAAVIEPSVACARMVSSIGTASYNSRAPPFIA